MASFKHSFVLTFLSYMAVIAFDRGAGLIIWGGFLKDDPADKGALDLIGNLGFILMAFGNLGLATSLVYFLRRKAYQLKEVVETSFAMGVMVGTLLAVLGVGGVALVSHFADSMNMPAWYLLLPAVAVVPLLLCNSYLNSTQVAMGRIGGYNLVNLIPSLLFLPVFFGFYLFGNGPVRSSIWSRGVVTVLAFLVATYLVRRLVKFRPRIHREFLGAAVNYGWRANVMSLFTVLGHRADLYLVAALVVGPPITNKSGIEVPFGDYQAGIYSVAVTLAELVWHLPESMRDVFFERVAGQNKEESRAFTPVVTRNLLAFAILIAFLVFFPVSWLVDWYFPEYSGTTTCMRILLPGSLAYVVAKILHFDLAGRGRINLGILCTGTTVGVMVIFDVLLIPTYCAEGAALASLIAYLVSAVVTILIYARVVKVPINQILIPRRSDLVHYAGIWDGLKRRLGKAKGDE